MDGDNFLTPRKLLQNALARTSSRTSMASSPSLVGVRTPTSLSRASNSSCNTTNSRFNLLPVLQTPPSRMLKGRVVNPFEPHLADRLHLPIIGSPSLFQRPSTPHNSSISQFEWTIEEVSSLGPANVEVHETQFLETPDPIMEARVQAAISTYFKEHSIVPSPIDCPLRNQKITLSKDNVVDLSSSVNGIGRSRKKNRDGVCQTVLTFPPKLPKEVEDVLQKYLTFKEDQHQGHSSTLDESSGSSIDHDARDASLRRKLFNTSTIIDCDAGRLDSSLDDIDLRALSPAPVSPEVLVNHESASQDFKRSRYFGSQDILHTEDISLSPVIENDSDSSFGALSPISKSSVSSSPNDAYEQHHSDVDAIYRSTPEPSTNHSGRLSLEHSGSRLFMNGSIKHTELTNVLADANLSTDGEKSLSSSSQTLETSNRSQHSVTPLRRQRRKETRRNHRKNLSQSFQVTNDNDRVAVTEETTHKDSTYDVVQYTPSKALSPIKEIVGITSEKVLRGVHFYRTDSGFNEESQSNDYANDLSDVSMLSEEFSNTPVRKRHEIMLGGNSTIGCENASSALRL